MTEAMGARLWVTKKRLPGYQKGSYSLLGMAVGSLVDTVPILDNGLTKETLSRMMKAFVVAKMRHGIVIVKWWIEKNPTLDLDPCMLLFPHLSTEGRKGCYFNYSFPE